MDDWFYNVVPTMLRYLRDYGTSCPYSMYDEYGDEKAFDKWREILTNMADCIEAGGERVNCSHKTPEQVKALEELRKTKFKYGIELMTQYMDSLWD